MGSPHSCCPWPPERLGSGSPPPQRGGLRCANACAPASWGHVPLALILASAVCRDAQGSGQSRPALRPRQRQAPCAGTPRGTPCGSPRWRGEAGVGKTDSACRPPGADGKTCSLCDGCQGEEFLGDRVAGGALGAVPAPRLPPKPARRPVTFFLPGLKQASLSSGDELTAPPLRARERSKKPELFRGPGFQTAVSPLRVRIC